VEWQLGQEHWARGDRDAAEAKYQAALTTFPGYHRALAGLAQVRASRGRLAEAVTLLERAIAAIPQLDYVVALGDLHAALGQAAAAERQYALAEHIGRLSTLNQVLYNRELAWFYLDHDRRPTMRSSSPGVSSPRDRTSTRTICSRGRSTRPASPSRRGPRWRRPSSSAPGTRGSSTTPA
jgi:tetratricopeptide (TPR) repeat protein